MKEEATAARCGKGRKKGVLLRSSLSPKRRWRFLKFDPNPAPIRDEEVRLRRSRYVVYTSVRSMQPGPFLVPKWLFTPGEKKRGGGRDKSPPFPAHTYSTRMRGGKQGGGRGSGGGINGKAANAPPIPLCSLPPPLSPLCRSKTQEVGECP